MASFKTHLAKLLRGLGFFLRRCCDGDFDLARWTLSKVG